jgi:hypothetical protein
MRVFRLLSMTSITVHGFGQTNRSSSISANGGGVCVAEARWANGDRSLQYSKPSEWPVSMTLLAYVSKGSPCTNTEVRVTATFLNEANETICSGIIPAAMTSAAEVQIFNLEIRPLTQQDFLRWRNEPGARGLQQGKALKCLSVDGTSDVSDMERAKAASVHITVAVLPPHGGLAVLDAMIRLNP